MKQYLEILKDVLENGKDADNRTGIYARKVFGRQMRFDLSKGFPLVTTKKTFFKGIVHELIWLISGNTNIKYLRDNNVHIWDEWADENGNLGPVYGHQWRNFNSQGYDQIKDIIERIKNNPQDRRIIVSAWNPAQINQMALPPCHCFFQFDVSPDNKLNCMLYQRSCDMFLGVPFNIASYSLLTMMIAQVCDLQPGEFVHTLGNAHIYSNHFEQVKLQLTREPLPLPMVKINPNVKNIDDFRFKDFELVNIHCEYSKNGLYLEGSEEFPLENIVLKNVLLKLDGGVQKYNNIVPEEAQDYPEVFVYGRILPAKGIYFRYVNGLTLDNVIVQTYRDDKRESFVFEKVNYLKKV